MGKKHTLLLALSFLFGFFAISFAQLGQQAGQPTLNVSLGGSATFNYTIINAGDSPISYVVIIPALNAIPHNVTPTVKITPMNGTLAPHSQQVISIKVYMPYNDKAGLTWQGIVQVVEAPSAAVSSSGASATVTAGVAKILTIHSTAPAGWPLWFAVGIAVMIVAISGGSGYYFFVYRKKAAEKAALEERRAKAKRAVVAIKKPKAAARKAARKPAKKGAAKKKAAKRTRAARAKAARRRAG